MGEVSAARLQISVNGEPREVDRGATIETLLAELSQHPSTVAVEYNGAILKRVLYATTQLETGDRLELVRFVQGGISTAMGSPAAVQTLPGGLSFARLLAIVTLSRGPLAQLAEQQTLNL